MAQQIVTPTFSPARWGFFHRSVSRLRLPPASLLSHDDIAFAWDPSHNPYRDTLNGIDLTATSAPVVGSVAGHGSVLFDGVDDELAGAISLGTMSGNWVMFLVGALAGGAVGYAFCVEDAGNGAQEHARLGHYTVGAVAARRSGGVEASDLSGTGSVVGKVELLTGSFTSAAIEARTNGTSNGSTADAKAPTGIDRVTLGTAIGGNSKSNSHALYALVVNASAAAVVEPWILANFPIGASV